MGFKILVDLHNEMQIENFVFCVLSRVGGIELLLIEYRIKAEGSRQRRWMISGNDGSFLNRSSITIPETVVVEAIDKAAKSISISAR